MTERWLSGYCVALDGARTVLLEDDEADCAFPACKHQMSCPLAQEIRLALENAEKVPQAVEEGKIFRQNH